MPPARWKRTVHEIERRVEQASIIILLLIRADFIAVAVPFSRLSKKRDKGSLCSTTGRCWQDLYCLARRDHGWRIYSDGSALGAHQERVRFTIFVTPFKEFMHSPLSSPEALAGGDCCGNGEGHTRDGTPIDIFDRVGIKVEEKVPGMLFEAAWGPDGAVCIGHVRIPELGPLEDLVASCPRLKSVALGGACQETAPAL